MKRRNQETACTITSMVTASLHFPYVFDKLTFPLSTNMVRADEGK